MMNRDRIKRAFDALQPSHEFYAEEIMNSRRKNYRTLIAVCAAAVVLAFAATAYAADLGGVRRIITVWFRGEAQSVAMEMVEPGHYELRDSSGKLVGEGGSVAFEDDGSERPLTMDELQENLQFSAEAVRDENGRVWIYFQDQKVDITDRFEGNTARIQLRDGGNSVSLVIRDEGDGAYSVGMNAPESGD